MINFSELLWKAGRTRIRSHEAPLGYTPEQVERVSALDNQPVDEAQLRPENRIALLTDSRSAVGDRFRLLGMRLRELRQLVKLRSLVITSPLPGDGKSTIAMSLATALAGAGKQAALVIEADLHHPSITSSLGLKPRPGLSECLRDRVDPMLHIRKVEPLAWYLLQAGQLSGNPTELLRSDELSAVMQAVLPYFDWILIDAPPVLPVTDALSLSRQADATLLVAWAGRTSLEAIEESLNLINRKHVLGIVLNGTEGRRRPYSKYYEHYQKP